MTATLPLGYTALPSGLMANVVTCLEMTARPALRPAQGGPFALEPLDPRDLSGFRALFKAVGAEWMWFSRLTMADEKLAAILGSADVEDYALIKDGARVGLLELDFREEGQCELSFFGVVPKAMGGGAGRFLMNEAITRAWARPIRRFWVHTCTYDAPAALPFYIRSGFTPYQRMVEIHADPRLSGHLPREACPQLPLI